MSEQTIDLKKRRFLTNATGVVGAVGFGFVAAEKPGIVAGCIGGGSPTVVASWATMHVLDANQSLHSFQNAGNLGIASSKCEGAVVHSIADGIFAVSTGAEGIH